MKFVDEEIRQCRDKWRSYTGRIKDFQIIDIKFSSGWQKWRKHVIKEMEGFAVKMEQTICLNHEVSMMMITFVKAYWMLVD